MRRYGKLNTPGLNTNAPPLQFGQILMNNAQRGLEFNEQKRQNEANNLFKDRQLLQQDKQFNKTFGLSKDRFEETKKQNGITNDLNVEKFGYTKLWNKLNHDYKVEQDGIKNNQRQQQIDISKSKANNPSTDIQKTLLAANIDPNSDLGQKFQKAMLVKKTLVPTVDANGNTVMKPISHFMGGGEQGNDMLTNVNITKKTNDVDTRDVEDLNKAIEIANSINYAHDNWDDNYTGIIDDKLKWAQNLVGINTPEMQNYNKWVANLQSVANAARNKSFGAALSGFDIEEFAKEFPASNAGDGTVIPKLKVKMDILNNALSNTYNTWKEKYGQERADSYFKGLSNKPYLNANPSTQNSEYSDAYVLKRIGAN